MFNVGTGELLVILLVALIVLGPERLPDTARKIGNVVGELRRMSQGFQSEVRRAIEDTAPDLSTKSEPELPPGPPKLEPVDDTRPETPGADDSAA